MWKVVTSSCFLLLLRSDPVIFHCLNEPFVSSGSLQCILPKVVLRNFSQYALTLGLWYVLCMPLWVTVVCPSCIVSWLWSGPLRVPWPVTVRLSYFRTYLDNYMFIACNRLQCLHLLMHTEGRLIQWPFPGHMLPSVPALTLYGAMLGLRMGVLSSP